MDFGNRTDMGERYTVCKRRRLRRHTVCCLQKMLWLDGYGLANVIVFFRLESSLELCINVVRRLTSAELMTEAWTKTLIS